MTLAAAQVVDTLAARLVGLPLTGSRVYTDRLHPLTEAELPAWRVVAETEDVEQAVIEGMNVHRLAVVATGYVQAESSVDDAMHALAAQGLTALCALPAPHGLQLVSIERNVTTEGEARLGSVRLTVSTQFYVRPEAPETIVS